MSESLDSRQINWERIPALEPVAFSTHCEHHRDLKEARRKVEEMEARMAQMESELGRRYELIRGMLKTVGGQVVIAYDDFGNQLEPVEVFGWKGEHIVVQDHPYEPADAKDLP